MNDRRLIGLPRPRLLIVDDEPANIEILTGLLSEYRCSVALNGTDAIEITQRLQPDLILLDVTMPGISGFEVCQQLKTDDQTADIPVIFITSHSDIEHERSGFAAGAVDYITKPFSPPVVKARVETHLSLRHAREALKNQNQILELLVDQRTAQLRQALHRVKQAKLDTIVRLSRAAEFRDNDTGAHILRMGHYSAAIARQLGLNDGEVETLLHAAPMHDIGKIGIPDRILLKPGKLNSDEWEIMRKHTVIGADILKGSQSGVIKQAEVIALTHHEKWDGSGYPSGLSGSQIPLSGQIVAIADVFDALTSQRPYKEAFSLKKSYGIIKEGEGRHFNPRIVKAFLEITPEIEAIRTRHQTIDAAQPVE